MYNWDTTGKVRIWKFNVPGYNSLYAGIVSIDPDLIYLP